ncbi:MAG: glutamyl-tRNA reductase [Actinomycetota bacterium]|nr:glutamyl-tRNA reductase [Actinomycetota bacterium]
MSVVVVGIEHQQSPLELLERVTVGDAELAKVLAELRSWENVQEAVVLSTCLRTEVYAVVDRFHDAVGAVSELLAQHAGLEVRDIQEHTAVRFDDDVAIHLFSVAAGLESAIPGETEVLGQVRRAWERAQQERAAGPVLGELFRSAVQAGKRVRAETGIAKGTTSFSFAAIELADRRRSGGLQGAAVTVVGAGEMGAGLVHALGRLVAERRPASVVVVNRNVDRARQLAQTEAQALSVRAVGADQLSRAIAASDVVFTAVESGDHVLTTAALAPAAARPGGVLVVDLGMPRNVEPSAAGLDGVVLFDMADLRSAITRTVDERRGEAERAAGIVAEELVRYRTHSRERGAAPVVSALRARMEELRVRELERHRAQLAGLGERAAEEVDAVTRAVLAKVLHEPTVVLRETSGTSKGERLVEALRALFDL